MTYEEAKATCHVRSAIFRRDGDGEFYWKNHTQTLDARVSDADKLEQDWEEYDPRDHESCSSYDEMPA